MKSLLRFALVAGALAALPSLVSAAPRFYAQPALSIIDVDSFDAVSGPTLAVGAVFAERHAVELEASRFELSSNYGVNFDLTALPVLLNYRYEIATTERWLVSAGLSLGAMRQEVDVTEIDLWPGLYYHYRGSDEAFVVGFHAGVAYRIDERLSIRASAKSLRAAESDVFPRKNYVMLQIGLSCRF